MQETLSDSVHSKRKHLTKRLTSNISKELRARTQILKNMHFRGEKSQADHQAAVLPVPYQLPHINTLEGRSKSSLVKKQIKECLTY